MSKEATLTHASIQGVQIPVIYEHSALIPAGIVRLVFQGGGKLQDGELIGRGAVIEELLEKGSKKRGNLGFAKALEQRAITLSVSSGMQTLSFSLNFLQDDKEQAISLLGELLLDPNLSDTELQKVKTAITAQILANQNDYDYLAKRLLNRVLFDGTPLAHPKLGTQKSIAKIRLQDVQKALESTLTLQRLIIILGGDIDKEATLALLEPILSKLPQGTPYTKPSFSVRKEPATQTQYAPTQQAYIYFGAPLHLEDLERESHLAKVASFILGSGGFGSRILEEVRVKRGLAYSAYIHYNINPRLPYMSGYLQTKVDSSDEALEVVRKTIAEFVAKGVSAEELQAAKRFILGSEPLRNESLSQRLGRAFDEFYADKGIGFSKKELEKIASLDLPTLNAYIAKHTEIQNLSVAIVTAKEKKQKSGF
ncbi:insulinase family protein [Helicobacter sp. XJK30-2]|uniref:Insulinase family protein n=1 Tax=Helicobacter zhangjianzhongii TaxID=2974574 RepID=A0ACC6FS75_9HELI|nr:pitrilysin family protein [Helicobacter sp. XJK30-2]MDL0081757.1 insulinase family protein [Helicobacter sp. XJK30-2]